VSIHTANDLPFTSVSVHAMYTTWWPRGIDLWSSDCTCFLHAAFHRFSISQVHFH